MAIISYNEYYSYLINFTKWLIMKLVRV
jgi:hypothetical protein